MAIGDTYPGDPVGRRTVSRVTPYVSQEPQGASWTAPWQDLWDDSLTKKAATGIMNVARDVGSNYIEDARLTGEYTADAIKSLVRPGTRDLRKDIKSLGQGYSDWYNKKYPGGLSDLGKDIITEATNIAATPADTALALASGMVTSVYAPYRTLPTLLKSDFTREGMEDWTEELNTTAENFPTYHARTPVGKGVTEFVGTAWEIWNEQVSARAGRGIENILKSVGVDYKNAERAGAATAGIVGAAPVVAPSVLRVRGETGVYPVKDTGHISIRNAKRNQLASISNPDFMLKLWTQMDPKGVAKAKADGTLNKKLSDMGWEFNEHISDLPVLREQMGVVGDLTIKPRIIDGKKRISFEWPYEHDRLGEYRTAKEQIALDPLAIDMARDPKDIGSLSTPGHELTHDLQRHTYKELFPEGPPRELFEEWLRAERARGRDIGKENFRDLAKEHQELRKKTEKEPWGFSSDSIPSVKKLSDEISRTQFEKQKSEARQEAPDGENPFGYYPPPPKVFKRGEGYVEREGAWNFEIWENHIRRRLELTAEPAEIHARLDSLQRWMKEADLGVEDIFTRLEHLGPGNWRAIVNPKLNGAPTDVQQLVQYLNDLVLDKYNELQRVDVERVRPIDDSRQVGRLWERETAAKANIVKARHEERMSGSINYVMDMLTKAIADTQITFPTRYKVGLVGR